MTATTLNDATPGPGDDADLPQRRDMLTLIAGGVAALGTAAALWPFVSSLNPGADVLAMATTEVDLAPITEGQGVIVLWQGKPTFVRHRTAEEIEAAQAVPLAQLPDPQADADRVQPGHEAWLVTSAVCTHLGCVPGGSKPGEPRGEFGGWFCACHGSQYDTSGRIRKGPAPANLPVPPYRFETESRIVIG